ncbi:MAG: hypothetical protein PVJ39_08895 [Gammaproteobacteria bacterium]|jgi:hypothetical protein
MKRLMQITGSMGIALAALVTAPTLAAPPVQHVFSNGQPADANQVNENFQELADRIEEIPVGPQGEAGPGVTQIDFDPYRHNFSTKTFKVFEQNPVTQLFEPLYEEVRTYDRSVPGELKETRTRYDRDQIVVLQETRKYTFNANGDKLWTQRERTDEFNPSGTVSDYSPPIKVLGGTMIIGLPWASAAISHNSDPLQIPPSYDGITHDKRTLLAQESITVNNVVYDDCLRLLIERNGVQIINWYCNGYGLVKRIGNRIFELVPPAP